METYEFHPIANLLPLMEGKDLEELVNDIKANGFNPAFSIILYEGKILDGRNRYRACHKANIEPRYESPKISDPFVLVISANLHRRHLTVEQRAFIADEMCNMKQHDNRFTKVDPSGEGSISISQPKAAKLMQIGASSVYRVRNIKTKGINDLVNAAKNGEVGLEPAYDIAKLPKDQQAEALKKATAKAKPAKAKTKRSKSSGPTIGEMYARSAELLKGPLGVSRKEFDPDFKGDSQDFIDQYGHVQIWTKKGYEASNDQIAFDAWKKAIQDLQTPLKNYLECKPFKSETFAVWVTKGSNPDKRRALMQELASMIVRTKESIEWLIAFLEQPK